MEKFYYALNNDAYIELDEKTYNVLNLCIDIITLRVASYSEKDMPMHYLLKIDESARLADSIIKTILTPEQYEKYKSAPLY